MWKFPLKIKIARNPDFAMICKTMFIFLSSLPLMQTIENAGEICLFQFGEHMFCNFVLFDFAYFIEFNANLSC
jgi:hypothetical protein